MMIVLDVHSDNVKFVYKSTLISKATFFIILLTAFGVFVPFSFVLRNKDFWIKQGTFYEQPNVRYKWEYLFFGTTNDFDELILCDNVNSHEALDQFDACFLIKGTELDENFDGKIDVFNFELRTGLRNVSLEHFTLILAFEYKINVFCPLEMETLVVIQQNVKPFSNKIEIHGNLFIKQTAQLNCYEKRVDNLYNQSSLRLVDYENYNIEDLIRNYSKRNISTHLTEKYVLETTDTQESSFQLNLNLRFPTDKFIYRKSTWEKLKQAWIQYLAVYLVAVWFLNKIKRYVFRNNLVLFYKTTNVSNLQK